ncbi:MAG TPA: glutathione synthase [Kofleriaceae bacterium]|nr:glutathione synthase [Kofleriaceae bacterium]
MRLLFIVDHLDRLALAGDTSYALMLEAATRGDEVWTCQIEDLGLESSTAITWARPTEVRDAATPREAFTLGERKRFDLGAFHAVLMRKDPPLDVSYLHATWILDHARGQTVLVNDPHGLRELNEHLAVLRFPELTPPTICTRSTERLSQFLQEQGGAIIVKPVDGFGGLGIFLVRQGDPNASSIFETSTGAGSRWTLAQRYLPAAVEGDKRILIVDGEPVGAVLRVPAESEARGNLHVGGRAVKTTLDEHDRLILNKITPTLRSYGQVLVGIDVIGGMLTEINITSPTGVRHISRLDGVNAAAPILEAIARLARQLGK